MRTVRLLPLAFIALLLPASARAADSLTVTKTEQLTPRLQQLTMTTTALPSAVRVRVLLPPGYDTSGATRYPVIYLLHGSNNDEGTWTDDSLLPGFVDQVANGPAIVVMPYGGPGSEYADWRTGQQRWETFHIAQLLPYIDAHYRTIADRAHRAITGFSMGGLGTMRYATRHPDLFGVAAPMSGAVSLVSPVGQAGVAVNEALSTVAPGSIFGDVATQEVLLRGNSPVDLALNLDGMKVYMSSFTGLPHAAAGDTGDPLEVSVHEMSQELDAELRLLGLPHEFKVLGNGGHGWPNALTQAKLHFPQIMAAFANPAPAPEQITYASIDPAFSVFGWTVRIDRPAREFGILEQASKSRFALLGSGAATVTTPASYTPGRTYAITTTPAAAGQPGASKPEVGCLPEAVGAACLPDGTPPPTATLAPIVPGTPVRSTAVADAGGHLTLVVPLGPGNAKQEYVAGRNAATTIFRTTVRIAPAATVKACASRRAVRVTLPRGATRVRVTVDGQARRVTRRGRHVTLSLAGRPKGAVRVVVRARVGGRAYVRRLALRTCAH